MRTKLPCGCARDGSHLCPDHRRDDIASVPVTLAALALFIGAVAVWLV